MSSLKKKKKEPFKKEKKNLRNGVEPALSICKMQRNKMYLLDTMVGGHLGSRGQSLGNACRVGIVDDNVF